MTATLTAVTALVLVVIGVIVLMVGAFKACDHPSSTSDEVCKKGVLYYQDQEGRLVPALKLDWSLHSCGAEMTLTAIKLNYNSYVF